MPPPHQPPKQMVGVNDSVKGVNGRFPGKNSKPLSGEHLKVSCLFWCPFHLFTSHYLSKSAK